MEGPNIVGGAGVGVSNTPQDAVKPADIAAAKTHSPSGTSRRDRQSGVKAAPGGIASTHSEGQKIDAKTVDKILESTEQKVQATVREQALQSALNGNMTKETFQAFTENGTFTKSDQEMFAKTAVQFAVEKGVEVDLGNGQKRCCEGGDCKTCQKGVEVKTKEELQGEKKYEEPKLETINARESVEQIKEVVLAIDQKVIEPQLKDIPIVIPVEKITEEKSTKAEIPVVAKEEVKQENTPKNEQKVDEAQLKSAQDKEDARVYAERKLKEEEALIAKKNIEAEVTRIKELEAEIKKNTEVQNKVEKELAQFTKALKEELLVKKQAGDTSPISAVKVERYQALKMLKMNLDKTLDQQRISIIKAKQSLLKPLPKPVAINSVASSSVKSEVRPVQVQREVRVTQPVLLRNISQTRSPEAKPVQRVSTRVKRAISVNKLAVKQRVQPSVKRNLTSALKASSKLISKKVNNVVTNTRVIEKKTVPQVTRNIKTAPLRSIRQINNLKRVVNTNPAVRKPVKQITRTKPVKKIRRTAKNQAISKPVSKAVVKQVKRAATVKKTVVTKPVQMKKGNSVRQQRSRVQTRVRTANVRKVAQRIRSKNQAVVARKVNVQQRLNKASVRTLNRVHKISAAQKTQIKSKNSQSVKNINSIRRSKDVSQRLRIRRQVAVKQRNTINVKSRQRVAVNPKKKTQLKNNNLNQLRRVAVAKRIVKNRVAPLTARKVESGLKINKAQQRVVAKNLNSIRNISKKTIKLAAARNISKQKVAKPRNVKITKITQLKTKTPILSLKKKMTRKQTKLLTTAKKMKKQQEFDQIFFFEGIKKKKRVFLNKKLKKNIRLETKDLIIH